MLTKIKKIVSIKKKEIKNIAPKIIPTKKVPGKQSKKKPLVVASGEMRFWVKDGGLLSTMKDLRDVMLAMSKEQFLHHAGMGRNDFSSWVSDVLGDQKCASDLLKAKTLKSARSAVEKHLKGYNV